MADKPDKTKTSQKPKKASEVQPSGETKRRGNFKSQEKKAFEDALKAFIKSEVKKASSGKAKDITALIKDIEDLDKLLAIQASVFKRIEKVRKTKA